MKNKDMKFIMKISILLIISIIISLCIESNVFENSLYSEIKSLKESKTFSYSVDNFIQQGYKIEDKHYITINNDPYFLKQGICKYINNVDITFDEPIAQNLPISVYYTVNDEELSEKEVISSTALANSSNIQIQLGKQVNKIRIDIGDNVNQKFKLSKVTFNNTSNMIIWYIMRFLLILVLSFVILFYIFHFGEKVNLEKSFIIFGLLFGLLFMFIMPLNQIPDEHAHFESVYRFSNKILFIKDTNNLNTTYMRKCDVFFNSLGNISTKSLYNKTLDVLSSSYDTNLVEVGIKKVDNFFILYLPAAVTISFARIIHLNPIILYMLGRLTNLLIFLFLSYFGLKKMPIGKSGFFVISMLPMVLHQAASYSADAILNGLCFAFIGYAFYMLYSDNIMRRDIIIITILASLLAPSKVTYFPIIFIVIFIITRKFKNNKAHKIALSIFILCIVSTFLFQNMGVFRGQVLNPVQNGGNILYDGMQGYTTGFIFKNPVQFAFILINTLKVLGSNYIYTMFGASLGWLNVNLNLFLIRLFILLFILACLNTTDTETEFLNVKQKSLIFIIVSMVIVLIEVALFLGWTHFGGDIVEGIQGRYFIPILPLIMLLIRNNSLRFKRDFTTLIVYSTIILQAFIVINLFNTIISR